MCNVIPYFADSVDDILRCATAFVACVAGVNGEREGERERGRKMGFWEPIFLPRSSSPSPSPFTPATQATAFAVFSPKRFLLAFQKMKR